MPGNVCYAPLHSHRLHLTFEMVKIKIAEKPKKSYRLGQSLAAGVNRAVVDQALTAREKVKERKRKREKIWDIFTRLLSFTLALAIIGLFIVSLGVKDPSFPRGQLALLTFAFASIGLGYAFGGDRYIQNIGKNRLRQKKDQRLNTRTSQTR